MNKTFYIRLIDDTYRHLLDYKCLIRVLLMKCAVLSKHIVSLLDHFTNRCFLSILHPSGGTAITRRFKSKDLLKVEKFQRNS